MLNEKEVALIHLCGRIYYKESKRGENGMFIPLLKVSYFIMFQCQ